jgi:uncharacterized repeat protein (TIGR03803 family)
MRSRDLSRFVLSACVATATFTGCGGSQLPIGALGAERTAAILNAKSFRVLYRFGGGNDGAYPATNLIDVDGTFYGTTNQGGGYGCSGIGCGTVYSINADGVEKVLHRFGSGADGAIPAARLEELNGRLYGTTVVGGEFGNGTVYSITTSGKEKVLHSFEGGYADGSEPTGNLIKVNGALYGTTYIGGGTSSLCSGSGCGTVFSISTAGVEKVVHRFDQASDGQLPEAGLAKVHGVLYGTTASGGAYPPSGKGTIFSVTTSGQENVLYRFQGSPDAEEPQASLLNLGGTLYGTTLSGGTSTRCTDGCGAVFSVTTNGVETVLHSFGGAEDGLYPSAPLIKVDGVLYSTTSEGGTASQQCGNGCGTVFSITKTGVESVAYEFSGGTMGWYPLSGLLHVDRKLYGTAAYGGSGCAGDGCGIVFALSL